MVVGRSDRTGDAAPTPDGEAEPTRRRQSWVVAGATVLLLGGLVAGIYFAGDDGGDADSGGAASLSAEGAVACASSVVEGRVAGVETVGGGKRLRVALDVDRSYKPAGGDGRRVTFTTAEPDAEAYYRVGVRMLVLVPSRGDEPPTTYRAGDPPPEGSEGTPSGDGLSWGRAWVEKALPGSRELKCTGEG